MAALAKACGDADRDMDPTGQDAALATRSGVRLSTIMHLAKVRKEANFVIFKAAAGYTTNIPITEARKENAIIAHSFFGQKLPNEHGGPVRAPGARSLLLQKR